MRWRRLVPHIWGHLAPHRPHSARLQTQGPLTGPTPAQRDAGSRSGHTRPSVLGLTSQRGREGLILSALGGREGSGRISSGQVSNSMTGEGNR